MSVSSPQPLHLIIRFAIPILDLPLIIPSPTTTTPLQLAHQHIRPNLPASYRSCPIRLIASGALLPPSAPLATSLRLPSKTLSDLKGKSKAPDTLPPASAPIYIHCSVSTTQTLSSAALAAEASASAFTPAPAPLSSTDSPPPPSTPQDAPPSPPPPAAEEAPRGFDRLLTAGLSRAEIGSLRSQFLALTAHNHTPDTMPSPAAMRRLEERWLDNSTSPAPRANADGGAGTGEMDNAAAADDDDDDDNGRAALEDMLWGNLLGFFWPVGAAVWLMREEGVWSKRRQLAVVTGVLVNLAFGAMRVGGG
ncbi:MAG: hypothetical protein Q9197_001995 [Variospora fuerteventurae]